LKTKTKTPRAKGTSLRDGASLHRSSTGSGGGRRKRSRKTGDSDGETSEEGDKGDVTLEDAKSLLDDLDTKSMATLRAEVKTLSSKLNSAVRKTETLQSEVTTLSTTCVGLEGLASRPQESDRADTVTNAEHQKLLAAKDQLISTGLKHAEQNRVVIGILGTVFSQTQTLLRMASTADNNPNSKAMPAQELSDSLTAPSYTQIITMVNDTWAWTTMQKRSFYGSFQQIPVFKTEYELLKGKE
jgi:hypothetical protein